MGRCQENMGSAPSPPPLAGQEYWGGVRSKHAPGKVLPRSQYSFPGRAPPDGAHHLCSSVDSALNLLSTAEFLTTIENIFVIGGEAVYKVGKFVHYQPPTPPCLYAGPPDRTTHKSSNSHYSSDTHLTNQQHHRWPHHWPGKETAPHSQNPN